MPKKPCSAKGKSGVKWGDEGTCYTGPGKKAKMDAQRKAIKASQARKKKK
jgi:hypothetical protein